MADNAAIDWVMSQTGGVGAFIVAYWWILPLMAIAGWLILWIRKRKKYPLNSVIWERRGDDIITNLKDKLGRIKEHGIMKWKFLKSKDTLEPENYEYVAKCHKGTGCAHLIKYASGQYKIVDIRDLFKTYCVDCLTEIIIKKKDN